MHDARALRIALPGRGGAVEALDLGPAGRPYDVVFSHANGFNALTYRTILAPLAADLRILAYDLRGHGASTLPAVSDGRTGWEDLGEDLLALLERLDAHDVVLAGHSMGGTVSLLAAAQAPSRVRALLMLEPVLLSPQARARRLADSTRKTELVQSTERRRDVFPSREAAIQSYAGKGPFAGWSADMLSDYVAAGLVPRAEGDFTLACAKAWELSNYVAQGHDTWAAFDAAPRPIRILRAERGSTTAPDALAALPKDVRVETVPGATHFLPMEQPGLVAKALREAVA